MINKLCIIGHPSLYGGADCALLDDIKLWLQMGLEIYICHTSALDANCLNLDLESKGIKYLEPRKWNQIKGLDCISYCNGEALKNLKEIRSYARSFTWNNHMTWCFDDEKKGIADGLIDICLYETVHQYNNVVPILSEHGHSRHLFVSHYFDQSQFPFYQERSKNQFRVGRISRADLDKFNKWQYWIYERIISKNPVHVITLGYKPELINKCPLVNFNHPNQLFYKPGEINQQTFYMWCDVLVMTTDTFENLPRVGLECMSSGTILVVDNRGGWQLEVEDSKTGFLCNDQYDMALKASLLAQDIKLKNEMRRNAKAKLETEYGIKKSKQSWETIFNIMEKL